MKKFFNILLRPLQLKSLKKQHSESVAGLAETVSRMTPHTILFASNVMNYAFFRILGLHTGQNFVREYITFLNRPNASTLY